MTLLAALGCGLIAGIFLGFSNFVMPALARLRGGDGVRAMQSINRVVLNPGFLGVLLGTALICVGLALGALAEWSEPDAWLRFAGSCSYLVGTILVTVRCHVPRNDTLAKLPADGAEAERYWPEFVASWSAWNHVRGGAALVAAVLLTLALLAVSGCSRPLGPIAPPGSLTPAERLSELGIFEGELARQIPRKGFVPYDVNASLYADGARKRRFVYVPEGTRIQTSADRWELPVGSYLVKTFSFPRDLRNPALGERLIETRFMVRTEDGFTASTYVWNHAQTDALASRGDLDVPVSWLDERGMARQLVFHVPSTSQCAACHAGRALGFRSRQLDHLAEYDDGMHDQITHFASLGLIDRPPPAHVLLADPDGIAPLALRARSYLDANCSHCHGEGGSAERTDLFWDLEHTTLAEMPTCRATRRIDGRDRVLVPGHPEQSEFLARMRSPNRRVHMPRGPSTSADPAGISLLSAWVASLPEQLCEP
ncbi:MAG TPA: anthrone oxygenase family protein [Polyangiaceae bacterium]|nr:anthrone oxygenase family protein [Polyangiaceae bacterium]